MTPAARTRLCIAALLCLARLCALPSPAAAAGEEPPGVGSRLPAFTAADRDGRSHEIQWPAGEGDVFLFFFFDIASPGGLYGMTVLDRLQGEAGDFGLNILAVEAGGRTGGEFDELLGRYRNLYSDPSFPIAVDDGRALQSLFGVDELPVLFLVQRLGVVLDRRSGLRDEEWSAVAALIRQALKLPEGVLTEEAEAGRRPPVPEGGEDAPQPLLYPGDPVPGFEVVTLGGEKIAFSWPSEEKALDIFLLWGAPCRSCIREILFLDQLHRRAEDTALPLRVLAAGVGGVTEEDARALLERIGRVYPPPSFPFTSEGGSTVGRIFGWGGLPSTFFVDGEGRVVFFAQEFEDAATGEWLEAIDSVLPGAAAVLRISP